MSEIEPWIIWCDLNEEQDKIARALNGRAISIYGSLSDDEKEKRIKAWLSGEKPYLISKPSICGFGLNFQRARNMAFVGLSDSFEAYFQAVRRCWRFGQKKPVNVHIITGELEGAVAANIKEKEQNAVKMIKEMVNYTKDITRENISSTVRDISEYKPEKRMEVPVWM